MHNAAMYINAKLVMCVEALTKIREMGIGNSHGSATRHWLAESALSATEQDVIKWRREIEAKAIEECMNTCYDYDCIGFDNQSLAEVVCVELGDKLNTMAQKKRSEG